MTLLLFLINLYPRKCLLFLKIMCYFSYVFSSYFIFLYQRIIWHLFSLFTFNYVNQLELYVFVLLRSILFQFLIISNSVLNPFITNICLGILNEPYNQKFKMQYHNSSPAMTDFVGHLSNSYISIMVISLLFFLSRMVWLHCTVLHVKDIQKLYICLLLMELRSMFGTR